MKIEMTTDSVKEYARLYQGEEDDRRLATLMTEAASRGHMTLADLIEVARWKWRGGRTRQLVSLNLPEDVEEITSVSFSARSERLRVGALLSLSGVQWPMASVILHFAFPKSYPILDVRAMITVQSTGGYNFNQWMQYTEICRTRASELGVTMRELDRALWAVNKEASEVSARKSPGPRRSVLAQKS